MQIVRSCGVSTIATYLSLMRQDLSLVLNEGDRRNTSPEEETDPASESHVPAK